MPKKTRTAIPKETHDKVLAEYNHRCAICGNDRPQLHHINENPADHDLENLLPLCPNCHIVDQHNPTVPHNARKMKLFRVYKDPSILSPQFHVLFNRLQFLEDSELETDIEHAGWKAARLVNFIAELQMGEFYSSEIGALIREPAHGYVEGGGLTRDDALRKHYKEYRTILQSNKNHVYELAVELLRFQSWHRPAA